MNEAGHENPLGTGLGASPLPKPGPRALLLRGLGRHAALTEAEQAALPEDAAAVTLHAAGAILGQHGELEEPRLVTGGWASRERQLPDGRRQITGVLIPGDCIGLAAAILPGELAPCDTTALTPVRTIDIQPLAARIRAEPDRHPGLLRAFGALAAIEHARLVERIVTLGRRTAVERVAHFLLELRERLEIAGIGGPDHYPIPLSQETLADLLGLSTVHVNRTLQQLRRDHLLTMRSARFTLIDPVALAEIADYRPMRILARSSPMQASSVS